MVPQLMRGCLGVCCLAMLIPLDMYPGMAGCIFIGFGVFLKNIQADFYNVFINLYSQHSLELPTYLRASVAFVLLLITLSTGEMGCRCGFELHSGRRC